MNALKCLLYFLCSLLATSATFGVLDYADARHSKVKNNIINSGMASKEEFLDLSCLYNPHAMDSLLSRGYVESLGGITQAPAELPKAIRTDEPEILWVVYN